ncbi:MAG: hypothetical protein MIL41_20415 [Hyphomicrobiales bacterium]|jgi:hypothetical protein
MKRSPAKAAWLRALVVALWQGGRTTAQIARTCEVRPGYVSTIIRETRLRDGVDAAPRRPVPASLRRSS